MSFNCPLCEKQYPKLISLSLHFRKGHKSTSEKLSLLLFHNGQRPTCGCGCGGEVKFLGVVVGFRNFIRGHAARIPEKNNFTSKKAQENSIKTRRKMWKDGDLKIWNKGLTKETHQSVAQYGKSGSKTINSNPEELEIRSKRMKEGRLNGTVPTLFGSDHSQWKGGTSSLLGTCHSNSSLYKRWKYPLLIEAKFSCQKCGKSRNEKPRPILEVHHDDEPMCDIVRKIAQKCNWKNNYGLPVEANNKKLFQQKQTIAEAVADYHIKNNISGIVLCVDCHKKQHPKHNF